MSKMLNNILSADKARKQFKSATGGLSNEGDGIIGISVSVPKVPGTSIYGEIDTEDISNSRVGISGGVGGGTSISIGKSGANFSTKTSLGLGSSNSASVNIGGNGDVSASANTTIASPFGDFSIDVDIVKDGCTITVSKTFTSPFKTFTTTETYTAPGCKPKDPSPSPSSGPNGEEPDFPQGRCIHHLIYMGIVSTTWIYYPNNHFYNGSTASFSQVLSVPATFRAGVAPGVTFSGEGNSFMISSSNSTWSVSEGWWPSSKSFGKTLSEVMPGPNVPFVYEISYAYIFFKNNTALPAHSGYPFGYSYMYSPYDKARVSPTSPPRPCSFAAYFNTECQGTYFPPTFSSPSPNWNPPPKKMDKCCKETASMLRKIMKVLAVDDIEKNGIKIPKEFLAPGGTGQLKVTNYAELQLNLFRTVNRYGIDTPIRIKIKDVNKAKKGDQSVDVQFNSPAAAIQALVELAIENKGDAATRLQIQVRLIYAVTRTLKMVAQAGETVREIMKMLGGPFTWVQSNLPLEFDLTAGLGDDKKNKGFGGKQEQKEESDELAEPLKANDEDTTESLLPAILTNKMYKLPVPRFVQTEDDIQDFLVKIMLLLGSKK